ncbi:MAG: hypothetical protein IJ751_10540 [Oscillospiraceae bacterium]|nr:hypothetical protein [Oscillospiraceae bacterium]
MRTYNDIGISSGLDWPRIRHLMKIGIVAALLVLAGDMILGYGAALPGITGVEANFSRYLGVSDARVFWSALLGLIGIPLECLSYFAVYRVIAARSPRLAHAYRAGIFGCLIFGALVHVLCCAAVFFGKRSYAWTPEGALGDTLRFIGFFLLPAMILFLIFFVLLIAVQIRAFARGMTPYPRWYWVFSVLFGVVSTAVMKCIGDAPIPNAIATGWISVGNLWMFAGLLGMSQRAEGNQIAQP